jgi:antitoxin component YwqK of YwqJK toxin-antitoxin module
MRHILHFIFLFCIFPCAVNAQWIKDDSLLYENGKYNWISWKTYDSSHKMSRIIQYYYENGTKKMLQSSDSAFTEIFIMEFWRPDGVLTVSNGFGKYIEVGKDSSVYTIQAGVYEGEAKTYHRYYIFGGKGKYTPWREKESGNYKKGLKNGEWIFRDSSLAKRVVLTYENDTVSGLCEVYYPFTGIIKESGTLKGCSKEGLWKFYDSTGVPESECNYVNGERTGKYIGYYPDGKVKIQGQYNVQSKKVNVQREDPYSPGTFRRHKTIMSVPVKTGDWIFYDENGAITKTVNYHNKPEAPEGSEAYTIKHRVYYDEKIHAFEVAGCRFY